MGTVGDGLDDVRVGRATCAFPLYVQQVDA